MVDHGTVAAWRTKELVFRTGQSRAVIRDEQRATELALQLQNQIDQVNAYELQKLDCSLYAAF